MNVNASIIDQRLSGIVAEIREDMLSTFRVSDPIKLKSYGFVYLCVKTILDLDMQETLDCMTEGGGDFGIDAFHITEENDGEFAVTLFQAKYKSSLNGDSHFPENGIEGLIRAIRYVFDPSAHIQGLNDRLLVKVELARSMIRDGLIPRVRAVACNNGIKWNSTAQTAIERAGFGEQVIWDHVNHDTLVGILRRVRSVNETLHLTGKAVVEDLNFSRVCIGRIPVAEIAALMKSHGESLLERNIRRYLGLHGNRVNEGIRSTLLSENPSNFYFFNNGLTLVCSDFSYNALQSSNYQVRVDDLQIVNGGQTCMTIYKTVEEMQSRGEEPPGEATVLVRIYKLPRENEDIILQITQATNSQNPVDLRDLRSNDEKQRQLEIGIRDLGFAYRRKRMDGPIKTTDITSGVAAEAILAIWRDAPHQAKFMTREHFGRLYERVFSHDLNSAQTIVAVLLYRIAENHRRRPVESDPNFVRYASCFIAMGMGRRLLKRMGIELAGLNHHSFLEARQLIENEGEFFFQAAVQDVAAALQKLYGQRDISMQQLSATFRRGDLIELLSASYS